MSVFSMGLSYDFEKGESEILLGDDSRQGHHDHYQNDAGDVDVELWPVEHPMEPQHEDRPVKCPLPTCSSSSPVINDGRICEKRQAESLSKRAEESSAVKKEGIVIVAAEPPIRKRHHTLANADHVMMPLTRLPSLSPPPPTQNITIFQMLQQLDEFEP